MTASPVRYNDAVETPIDNEEQVHRDLIDTMRSITETTSKDYGHAVRSVHAKAHGILSGELEIAAGLPPELAQGLFAAPGTHRALMRFSTNPGDILDDSVSAPRGLALKILDVDGERLPDSGGETTQNLILVNAPAFAAPDAKAFLAASSSSRRRPTRRNGARSSCPRRCAASRARSRRSAARAR